MIFLMFFLASLINYNKQTCASLTMPKNVHTGNLSKNNILQLKYLDKKGRIFGGQLVKNIKDYPYMAKLSIEDYSCSAVILSKYYIITAGHCFMGRDCSAAKKNPWSKNGRLLRIGDESCNISYVSAKESEIELYAGGLTESNASSISDVEEIYVHPDFQYYNSEKKCYMGFDATVLKLSSPLEFSDGISSVPLAGKKDNLEVDSECTILGWGAYSIKKDETDSDESRLRYAKVKAAPFKKCRKLYCRESTMCTIHSKPRKGICPGDSGGALICHDKLFGVISSTKGCGKDESAYTKVKSILPWIMKILSRKKNGN